MFDPAGRDVVSPTDAPVFVDAPDEPQYDEVLFHLFNATAAGTHLLVATELHRQREGRLPDLKSRLGAAPNIRIHAPTRR